MTGELYSSYYFIQDVYAKQNVYCIVSKYAFLLVRKTVYIYSIATSIHILGMQS